MAKQPDPRIQDHPRVTENRPLRYSDFDATGKAIADKAWADMGNIASNLPKSIAKADAQAANMSASETSRKNGVRDGNNLRAIQQIGVVDKPQTIESAANARVKLVRQAAGRAATEGDIRKGIAPGGTSAVGQGWYLEHADEIDRAARSTGHDTRTAIVSSTAMSPQNSPENEKTAVRALMRASSRNIPLTAKTPQGAKALERPIGESVNFNDITPNQLRAIGNDKMSKHVDSAVSLTQFGKGGTELKTGLEVLRGNKQETDIGKNTGKVPSYLRSTLAGYHADANDISEYNRRAHEALTDKPYFEQPTVFGSDWEKDPWSRASSTKGILDPKGDTAEDTWMQAISLDQPNAQKALPTGKESARLGKVLGSYPGVQRMPVGGIFPTAAGGKKASEDEIRHAMNNAATVRAAEILSDDARARGRNVGAGVPSVMVQETAWTEYRIQQGKDDEYQAKVKQSAGLAPTRRAKGQPKTQQLKLF